MLNFISGDMFSKHYDIRINPVNTVGVMGKGLALEFKRRYPQMFTEYSIQCRVGVIKPSNPGVWTNGTETIINFPTKLHWRNPSRVEYIKLGLMWLRDYLGAVDSHTSVAIPALGCGLGGLDWLLVKELMEVYLSDLELNIDVYKPRGY